MIKKKILIISVFLLSLVSLVNAQITTRGASWEETCSGNTCTKTLYSGIRYAQNSTGDWVNPSEVLYITKNQDDLTFHYNGIKGYYNVTFEAGVIYNGNYYDMATVKQNYPQLNFNFPSEKHDTYHKYAVNISNITGNLNPNLIENITLTYKDHYGFTLGDLKQGDRWFFVKDTLALYFEDLLEKHTLSINKTERRIYISNISQNIIDGSLYLDPIVTLQSATSGNIKDSYVAQDSANSNYGTAQMMYVINESLANTARSYITFNTSTLRFNVNITLVAGNLTVFQDSGDVLNSYVQVYHVYNDWVNASNSSGNFLNETQLTWNNQPCGIAFDNSTYCNMTFEDNVTVNDDQYSTFNVINAVRKDINIRDNISFVFRSNEIYGANNAFFRTKETGWGLEYMPVLTIIYYWNYPTYSLNQTNSTLAGTSVKHSLNWTGENYMPSGYIFSFDNCTGILANDTWVSFGEEVPTNIWSNVTKFVNSTVGCAIRWQVFANNSIDNWNASQIYSYRASDLPKWSDNQTSIPTYYSTQNSRFNMTWTGTDEISVVLIETNYSGSATNYTMSNSTYGGSVYSFSTILQAGSFYWKSYANDTYDGWNTSDTWEFTIGKNQTNPCHINITHGENYIDQDVTDIVGGESIVVQGFLNYDSSGLSMGTVVLYYDSVVISSPTAHVPTYGTHMYLVNTSGNENYTSNATGIEVSITVATTGGGGGGGTTMVVYHQLGQSCSNATEEEKCAEGLSCQDSVCISLLASFCGNGVCDSGESFLSCEEDCPTSGQPVVAQGLFYFIACSLLYVLVIRPNVKAKKKEEKKKKEIDRMLGMG